MTKRKAFNFYNSHWEQIKLLNKKQQLELVIAICKVQFLEENIENIEFKDNISTLVWTGIKHSIETSIKGFVSKQKGLGKEVDIPLTKGLAKGGAKAPYQEEEGEEKEQGKEEEKEQLPSFTYEKFISLFNEITKRNFKGDSKSQGHFNQRIKKYNGAEFGIIIRNAHKDDYLQQNPKYLTPEYITRENQMEKWLNYVEGKSNGQTRKKQITDVNPDIKNSPNRMSFD